MGLRGESQVSNDFPKIVDKIPDDRGRNRGKPGAGRSTRRTASKSKSLGFSEKRRESCGGPELIDSSPMMAFEERHLGRDRFYIIPISLAIRFPEKSFIIQLNSAHTDNNIILSNGYGIVLYPIDCSSIRKNRMCDR